MSIKNHIEHNLLSKFVFFSDLLDVTHLEDLTLIKSDLKTSMLNIACHARFNKDEADRRIDEVIAHFNGLPFAWWITPSSTPQNLSELLEKKGFRFKGEEVGMAVEKPCIPTDITELRVEENIAGFCKVLSAYDPVAPALYRKVKLAENDPLSLYTGYVDNEPVVTGALFTTDKVCGIYDVLTHPDHRQKGYGTAMLAALMEIADAELYTLSASSDEGQRLYEKFGFHPYCHFEVYTYGSC